MVILFDLDDTLVTHTQAARTAAIALHAACCPEIDQALFLATWQDAHRQYYPRYLQGDLTYAQACRCRVRDCIDRGLSGGDADRIFSDYLAVYRAAWALFPDVVPCLDAVASFPLGVISNGPSDEQRLKLSTMGIATRFQTVLISEECGAPKPNPEIYLEACRMAAVQPRDAICVGDRYDIDILGARGAGLRGIWLNRQGVASEAEGDVISSLQQLPPLVGVLARSTGR